MRYLCLFFVLLLIVVPAFCQGDASAPQKQDSTAGLRFSPDLLDKSIDPCTDFFKYACGKWLAANPIPPDRSSWGRFNDLQERGDHIIRDILEKAAAGGVNRTPVEQKIGDYYASCMDESGIESAGTKPLEADFQEIGAQIKR
jgi:endothelin-converting enzyme/putative endopeptidase